MTLRIYQGGTRALSHVAQFQTSAQGARHVKSVGDVPHNRHHGYRRGLPFSNHTWWSLRHRNFGRLSTQSVSMAPARFYRYRRIPVFKPATAVDPGPKGMAGPAATVSRVRYTYNEALRFPDARTPPMRGRMPADPLQVEAKLDSYLFASSILTAWVSRVFRYTGLEDPSESTCAP